MTPIKPIPTNTRFACAEVMKRAEKHEPWFGIEQEYTLLNVVTKWPLGWPKGGGRAERACLRESAPSQPP